MTTSIVLLTGSELRHTFLRKAVAAHRQIDVRATYCEGIEQTLAARLSQAEGDTADQLEHARARDRSEEDFFRLSVELLDDRSRPISIPKGDINSESIVDQIVALRPELLCAYGCSLVKSKLIEAFSGRFLNLHLGLSPYYRGSGTNYFPLVNGEPEYVGATFLYVDAGIDTGRIVHQIRARIFSGDCVHSIGNRLIADAAIAYRNLIAHFDRIQLLPQLCKPAGARLYQRKDFTPESLHAMHRNFAAGMVDRYLAESEARVKTVPIVQQPWLNGVGCE